jgi:regulator of sigma E protease
MISTLLTIIVFILILSVLVFVHEFGHFTVAKLFGVHVEEFGFGLPPRVIGKKIRGTLYSLNLLPIGGFVKLAGEDAEDIDREKHSVKTQQGRSHFFWAKTKKERIYILLAGVTMNFVLAIGITGFLLSRGIIEQTPRVKVETVVADSPAQKVGLRVGDIIKIVTVTVNGKKEEVLPTKPEMVVAAVNAHKGETIVLTIVRNDKVFSFPMVPRVNPPVGQGALGVQLNNYERHVYSWREIPWKSVEVTFSRAYQMLYSMGDMLVRLVTGQTVKSEEVSGPVGIAKFVGDSMKYGWEAVLEIVSILSLNLAILNILPFPALDGGRILFVVLEKLGKKARPQVERMIHQIGMMILLGLLLLITVNDILRIVRG